VIHCYALIPGVVPRGTNFPVRHRRSCSTWNRNRRKGSIAPRGHVPRGTFSLVEIHSVPTFHVKQVASFARFC